MGEYQPDSRSVRPAGTADRAGSRWLRQTRGFTVRYARELFRNKGVLFWTIGFPTGFYLITILTAIPSEVPSAETATMKAGMAISFGTFGAIIAALNSFCEQLGADLEDDRYTLFRSLSIAPTADFAGRLIAGTVLVLTAFLAVIPVALLTGAEFSLASPLAPAVVAVALVPFAVFWMVVAIGVAVSVGNERYASIITVSLALVAYMLTGYNGTDPSSYHGPEFLLNLMPHTLATRLITDQLVADGVLTPPAVPETMIGLALLTVVGAVSLTVGIVVVRTQLYERSVIP
ncbi:ABC transporter permease [Halovivax gelatinilyticus]|uniref:ABC transporter permease n=1 Tax=Halovivax gelatinilyticus TaxID=2961597 RepID=UPI0020CA869E|nr:ABC transporter permease [Halovivax gelatinilyticus]